MGLEQQVKILNTIKRLNAQDFVRLIKLRNINPKSANAIRPYATTCRGRKSKSLLGLLPWKSLIGLYATPQEAEYKSLAKDMLLLDSDTQTISDHSRSVLDSLMSEFDSLSKCADDYTQQAIQNAHSSTSLCIHILKVIDAVKISVKGRGMKPKVGTIDIKKMSTHFHVDSKTIDIACCCICDCKLAIPGRTSWELADNIPPLLKKTCSRSGKSLCQDGSNRSTSSKYAHCKILLRPARIKAPARPLKPQNLTKTPSTNL